jgi:hypothetical protein
MMMNFCVQEKHVLNAETLKTREAQWTSYAWLEVRDLPVSPLFC